MSQCWLPVFESRIVYNQTVRSKGVPGTPAQPPRMATLHQVTETIAPGRRYLPGQLLARVQKFPDYLIQR